MPSKHDSPAARKGTIAGRRQRQRDRGVGKYPRSEFPAKDKPDEYSLAWTKAYLNPRPETQIKKAPRNPPVTNENVASAGGGFNVHPHHLTLIAALNHHGASKGYTARSGKSNEREVVIEGTLRGFLTDDYTAQTEGGVEILYLYRPEDPDASDKQKYAPIQISCPLTEEQLVFLLSAIDWLLAMPIARVEELFDEADWIVDYPPPAKEISQVNPSSKPVSSPGYPLAFLTIAVPPIE